MATSIRTDCIPHSVIDLAVVGSTAALTVMGNYVRFYIEIDAADVEGDSPERNALSEAFIAFCDESDEEDNFHDWMIAPCMGIMRKVAPQPDAQRVFTLEDYFCPPTVFLRLGKVGGILVAEELPERREPSEWISRRSGLTEVELALQKRKIIPRLAASEFRIIPRLWPGGINFCDVPCQVQMEKNGQRFAFKAAYDNECLLREVEVYLRLTEAHLQGPCPFPKFHGLVVSGNELLGFVIEYVRHKGTLHYCAAHATQKDRERWFDQVQGALEQLHCLGLSWGDVKPDNVLIDVDGNAHVIDLGGGFNPAWVDSELAETQAGDLQGLDRLKAFLHECNEDTTVAV